MPIYEYRCEDCGNEFEKLVRRPGDASGLQCPSCGKNHLTPRLSTFAAHSGAGRPELPSCPGGVCRTPEICGRN